MATTTSSFLLAVAQMCVVRMPTPLTTNSTLLPPIKTVRRVIANIQVIGALLALKSLSQTFIKKIITNK
jgi:hypothetical protein